VLVLGPEIPARLVDAAADAQSLAAEFAVAVARELEDDGQQTSSTTLAALAQHYEDREGFGAGALRAKAEKFFCANDFAPSAVHATLATLPFPLVLTTSQDTLLARALAEAGKAPIIRRYHLRGDKRDNAEFMLPGVPSMPVVYHLFGEACEPTSLVLSENDILDFLIAIVSENPPLPNSLLRVLKRPGQSYIFVGFGIRHWHLRVLLKVLLRTLGVGATGNAVAAEPLHGLADRDDTILFYQRGTRVEVEDSDVGAFLDTLARRLASEGGFVGPTAPTGPTPRVFISYAREDSALAARLHAALSRSNFDAWFDRESLIGGEDWDLRIESELQTSDFALVLYTPALMRKGDSYVNKEIHLARRRAMNVRGSFLIPLRTVLIDDDMRVHELGEYNDMELRATAFDEDFAKLVSTMRREFQRRNR
jgi:hypothetical protein